MFSANTTGATGFGNVSAGAAGKAADISFGKEQEEHKLLGNLASAGGGLLATGAVASDKNEKKDIEKVSDAEMDDFLSKLAGFHFKYKHPGSEGEAPGDRMGVMAQDANKSTIGKQMVIDGKPLKLDLGNAVGSTLAAVAYLSKQLKEIKKSK